MSFLSFGGKQNAQPVLIVDIGSASVAAAIAIFTPGKIPTIVAASRAPIAFQEEFDVARFRLSMLDAVGTACGNVSRELTTRSGNKNLPRKAFVIFGSPWYASQTRIVSSTQSAPFRMTPVVLDRLTKREVDLFLKGGDGGARGADARLMEQHMIRIALNGYETNEPFGKEATSLTATLFISLCSQAVSERVAATIKKTFYSDTIEFHSFPFAAYDTIKNMKSAPDYFLHVDMGGEITDISLVERDALLETATFPIGKRTILRELAKSLKTTTNEALSLVRLANESRLSASHQDKVGKTLTDISATWVSQFEQALAGMAGKNSIPATVFVSSDDDVLDYCVALVKKESFAQYTITDEPFNVIPLSAATLHESCAHARDVVRDPFLMMDTIFANRLLTLVH